MGSFKGWNPSHNAARLGLGLFGAQHYFPPCCLFSFDRDSLHFILFRSMLCLFRLSPHGWCACHHAFVCFVQKSFLFIFFFLFFSFLFFFFCTQQTTCQLMSMSEIGFYKRNSVLWFSNTATQTLLVHIFLRLLKGHSACSAYSVINMKKARLYLLLMFISSG